MRSEPLLTDPVDAVTILLTALGSTWTEGRPSHSGTLECVWLLMYCNSDHTMSTGERTSLLSEFLLVCYVGYRCRVVRCNWHCLVLTLVLEAFEGPERPPSTLEHLCVAFFPGLTTDPV